MQDNALSKFLEFSFAVYYSEIEFEIYKGNSEKYKGKSKMEQFYDFCPKTSFQVIQAQWLHSSFDPYIVIYMIVIRCYMLYVIFGIYDRKGPMTYFGLWLIFEENFSVSLKVCDVTSDNGLVSKLALLWR